MTDGDTRMARATMQTFEEGYMRAEELSTISAIYPELVTDAHDPFIASIDLAINPSTPLRVRFQPAPLYSPPDSDLEDAKQIPSNPVDTACDEHELSHLPPLKVTLLLPEGYPDHVAPKVALSADPSWIPLDKLRELTEEVEKLWEEYGRMQVLFSYIDSLQQAAADGFGYQDTGLFLAPALKPRLLDYNDRAVKDTFDAQTFDCGICLEPKKGSQCYRLTRCSHVFCRACLQDSFNQYIKEGDVIYVRCLDPGCCKEKMDDKRKNDPSLHPRELLDMGLEEPIVRRYVEMKRKKQLESDKSTVYCPRTWCQGPARSKKYPPIPANLRDYPDDHVEDDEEHDDHDEHSLLPGNKDAKASETNADRLRICSKCSLAFCLRCQQGWHGDFVRCWPRNASELSAEEQASYEYIRLHTSPCPTCQSPTQKTMGCNHMICATCNSHFCFLCTSWLDGQNPYQHFNQPGKECYQRLWEHEEGDEANGGAGGVYFGARRWEQEARRVADEADRQEAEQANLALAEQLAQQDLADEGPPPAEPEPAEPALEAEALLVLEIEAPVPRVRHGAEREIAALGRGQGRGAWPVLPQLEGRVARRGVNRRGPGDGGRGRGGLAGARARAAAEDEAMRRFVALAQRDEEEDWDSDELDDDDEEWGIRPRD